MDLSLSGQYRDAEGRSPARPPRSLPIVSARVASPRLDNVLTYFDHRITNVTSEGLNSKIQTINNTLMASEIGSI
jgi:transposase